MALVDRIGKLFWSLRKAVGVTELVVKPDADSLPTASPTLDSGSGAAAIAHPNGSLWLRTDGVPEARIGGAWEAVLTAGQTQALSGAQTLTNDGTGTGAVALRFGATATEGLEITVYDEVLTPAAVETAVLTVPAGSVILGVQTNVETALTAGGTSVTMSIGTAADPDKYGTHGSDTLAQNAKIDTIPDWAVLSSGEAIVITAAATGGTADGDTAFSAGTVRARVVYAALNSLDDA